VGTAAPALPGFFHKLCLQGRDGRGETPSRRARDEFTAGVAVLSRFNSNTFSPVAAELPLECGAAPVYRYDGSVARQTQTENAVKPQQPKSSEEWQEAVNLAELYSRVDAAVKYGFISFTGKIDISRCEEILEQGRRRCVYPVQAQVDELIQQLVVNSSTAISKKERRKKTTKTRA
jgi:hypothetical protein